MKQHLEEFTSLLEKENRKEALEFILSLLEKKNYSLMEVYEHILAPSLNTMKSTGNEEEDIWKEHVRTSIIRTIVENCFPYVMKEREEKYGVTSHKTVAVVCPQDEHHELGARMITDYFTMLGYNAVFVGSNTPKEVFVAGLKSQKLDYIALSITNPYHLVSARNTIAKIREANKDTKIIAGGYAIKKLGDRKESLGADYYMTTFDDIISISGGTAE